jgi:hypothetical protein
MYNLLSNGDLVILSGCKDIINAIPSLMINPDMPDDVLKVNTRGDDAYDAFSYGLFAMLGNRKKPDVLTIEEHAKTLDPLSAYFYKMKMLNRKNENTPFVQAEQPVWLGKGVY